MWVTGKYRKINRFEVLGARYVGSRCGAALGDCCFGFLLSAFCFRLSAVGSQLSAGLNGKARLVAPGFALIYLLI
jgi:hypothetical protein